MAVRILQDHVPQLIATIEAMTRKQVLVGIPGDADPRKWTGVGISNAYLGFIHEFGSPAKNIPARPFLRPGIAGALPAIVARMRAGARKALMPGAGADEGEKALHTAGLVASSAVKRYLNAGVAPPLAAATLNARRTRRVAPRTGTVPLVDTAQLRNSVTYVVRDTRR